MARRLKAMGHPCYQKIVNEKGWTGETSCAGGAFRIPGKGKMVFVNSMGDLFYERNPFVGGLDVLFDTMLSQPQHTFQLLTKRPERALKYYREIIDFEQGHIGKSELANAPNIWLGVTCENQEWADKRIPILLQIPAAVRFLSLEPLLGPIDLNHITMQLSEASAVCGTVLGSDGTRFSPGGAKGTGSDWVIVGPERIGSRPGRPCELSWIKSIVHQCHDAGVPVHIKAVPLGKGIIHDPDGISAVLDMPIKEIRQWPSESEVTNG